jgi:hypothetical protein
VLDGPLRSDRSYEDYIRRMISYVCMGENLKERVIERQQSNDKTIPGVMRPWRP